MIQCLESLSNKCFPDKINNGEFCVFYSSVPNSTSIPNYFPRRKVYHIFKSSKGLVILITLNFFLPDHIWDTNTVSRYWGIFSSLQLRVLRCNILQYINFIVVINAYLQIQSPFISGYFSYNLFPESSTLRTLTSPLIF